MKEQTSKNLATGEQIKISGLKSSILATHLWNYITKTERKKREKK